MDKQIPKNVRQIGNVSDSPKIYIEDYVDTFLNQLCDTAEDKPVGAFLVGQASGGKKKKQDCVFISGAIHMEDIEVVGPDITIGEKVFAAAKEKRKEFFEDDEEIVGWFLIIPGSPLTINSNIRKLHEKFFTQQNSIFIMKDAVEKDEIYYAHKYKDLMQIAGHYIYYEKNPSMQDYMLSERKKIGVTPSEMVADKAAKDFRGIIRDKMEVNSRSQNTRWTYAASTFLILVVLIIGVTMINNYDRMKSVQSSLDSIAQSITNDEQEAVNVSADSDNVDEDTDEAAAEDKPAESEDADVIDENQEAAAENTSVEDAAAADSSDSEEANASTAKDAYETYTVEKGDTLAKISVKIYGNKDYVDQICTLNEITDGNKIYIGQKLLLP